jgi:CBS domain-containing protein
MKTSDVMTTNVEYVRPGDTVAHAAERMRDLDIGALPVCDENGKLVGMVTDRDVVIRATADGGDPRSTQVRAVMTPHVVTIRNDRSVAEAAQLMEEHQIRRLVVVERTGRPVGIVSLGDLAVRGDNTKLSGEALRFVSQPAVPIGP